MVKKNQFNGRILSWISQPFLTRPPTYFQKINPLGGDLFAVNEFRFNRNILRSVGSTENLGGLSVNK